jgi:hypothetical protein
VALSATATAWYLGDIGPSPGSARPAPPVAGATLALVGDSITNMASEELTAEGRRAGWAPAIDAAPGAMTTEMQPAAERRASTGPAAAVIHLGTNDWVCAYQSQVPGARCRVAGFTLEDRDRALATMAATMHDAGACVVGVVPVMDHGADRAWRRLADGGAIEGVADWRTEVADHHEYLADDLGHLSIPGRGAYARFVLASVAAHCGRPATTP